MADMPNVPDAPCCGFQGPDTPCMCDPTERAVRAYMDGRMPVPMTAEQRAWCVGQVRRASDATDQPDSFDGYDDAELARATYFSWVDYCRDKGLI